MIKIVKLKKNETRKIKLLLEDYPYKEYRNYRIFNKQTQTDWLFQQLSGFLLDKNSHVFITRQNKRVVGLVTFTYLPWDSKIFGIKMAKIGYLMASEPRIIEDLIDAVVKVCHQEKVRHLSVRIDTEDTLACRSISGRDFKIADTLVTYLLNTKKEYKIPSIRVPFKVRLYEEKDFSEVLDLARHGFSKDRFHLDPNLPNEKCDQFHVKWTKNCLNGTRADEVLVAERNQKVVGYLAYGVDKELAKFSKRKICGRGIGTSSPQAKGAHVALFRTMVERMIPRVDMIDPQTQINNYEVIRIWQEFGFRLVRSQYTFHKWIK